MPLYVFYTMVKNDQKLKSRGLSPALKGKAQQTKCGLFTESPR